MEDCGERLQGELDQVTEGEEEILSSDSIERFKCNLCDRSYKARKDLFKHHRVKHQRIKPVKHKQTKQDDQHPQAKQWSREPLESECNQCGEKFPSKTQLKVHIAIHNGRNVFKCDYCDAKFLWEKAMIAHKYTHTGERPYKCDLCEKGFTRLSVLYVHKRKSHNIPDIFTCDECGSTFQFEVQLKAHQVWCLGPGQTNNTDEDQSEDIADDNSFTGDECGKGCASEQELLMHRSSHGEIKLHTCRFCGLEFASASTLEEHESSHDERRQYSCNVCKWFSTSLWNLRLHYIRQHPGQGDHLSALDDKPQRCKYCHRSFKCQYYLQKHTCDLAEKSFVCKTCGSVFLKEYSLLQHQSACGITHFRCRHCKNYFYKRDRFLAHQNYCNEREEDSDEPDEFEPNHCESDMGLNNKDQNTETERTFACKECGIEIKLGTTALSNVFTLANISNVKCFLNNHTLI